MVAALHGGGRHRSRGRVFRIWGAIAVGLVGFGGALGISLSRPAAAQIPVSIGDLPQELYGQLPDLPLENQYRDRETGAIAQESTLLRRLVRYHLYVEARSPFSRLDWKLTLADYLGANQFPVPEEYPDGTRFEVNPLDGDVAAIRALDRRDRDRLIEVLMTGFAQRFQGGGGRGGNGDRPAPTESAPEPVLRQGGADALRLD
jgi:hypothetical protein